MAEKLEEHFVQLSQVDSSNLEACKAAFQPFRKAVSAVAAKDDADERLANLEPKENAIAAIQELYIKKPIYKKQIQDLMIILLKIESWRTAAEVSLHKDLLDLCPAGANKAAQVSSLPAPAEDASPTKNAAPKEPLRVPKAMPLIPTATPAAEVEGEDLTLTLTVKPPLPDTTAAAWTESFIQISQADPNNYEVCKVAFTAFRKATSAGAAHHDVHDFLSALEPKAPVMLVVQTMYKKPMNKRQVQELMNVLIKVESWRAAAEASLPKELWDSSAAGVAVVEATPPTAAAPSAPQQAAVSAPIPAAPAVGAPAVPPGQTAAQLMQLQQQEQAAQHAAWAQQNPAAAALLAQQQQAAQAPPPVVAQPATPLSKAMTKALSNAEHIDTSPVIVELPEAAEHIGYEMTSTLHRSRSKLAARDEPDTERVDKKGCCVLS